MDTSAALLSVFDDLARGDGSARVAEREPALPVLWHAVAKVATCAPRANEEECVAETEHATQRRHGLVMIDGRERSASW